MLWYLFAGLFGRRSGRDFELVDGYTTNIHTKLLGKFATNLLVDIKNTKKLYSL